MLRTFRKFTGFSKHNENILNEKELIKKIRTALSKKREYTSM